MNAGFGEVKEEIAGVRDEVKTGFGEMKDEMRTGFETLGSKQDQTIEEIRILRGDLKSYIEWMTETVASSGVARDSTIKHACQAKSYTVWHWTRNSGDCL